MRPTRLLLFLSLAAFLVSVLVIVVGQVSAAFALLIWGVLGVAVLIDIARSRPRGRLSLDIDMPEEAFSGEDSPATLFVADRGGTAPEGLECRLNYPDGLSGPDTIRFEAVEGGSEARFALSGRRRGKWQFDRIWLCWRGKLGLIEFIPSLPLDRSILIVPNI